MPEPGKVRGLNSLTEEAQNDFTHTESAGHKRSVCAHGFNHYTTKGCCTVSMTIRHAGSY